MGRGAPANSGRNSPAETQAALDRHEAAGTVTDPEYLAATEEFYRRHVCRVVPTPTDFVDSEKQMEAEPTVYHTMNGPNEFHVLGTLRHWTVIEQLEQFVAPTLVIAGEFDEATPATWQPYAERIAGAAATSSPTPATHPPGEARGVPRGHRHLPRRPRSRRRAGLTAHRSTGHPHGQL